MGTRANDFSTQFCPLIFDDLRRIIWVKYDVRRHYNFEMHLQNVVNSTEAKN